MMISRRKMWSFLNNIESPESRFSGKIDSFHNRTIALTPMWSEFYYPADEQFPDFESQSSIESSQNFQMEGEESSCIQTAPPNSNLKVQKRTRPNPSPAVLLTRKKKKKRRRRKKKNKANGVCIESPPLRQRQVSETASECSFIVFCDEESSDSTSDKKVRFAEVLCEVHPMIMWSYAYQAARKGPWEECARDRDRFRNRILNTEKLISPVLDAKHRSKIYEGRFA